MRRLPRHWRIVCAALSLVAFVWLFLRFPLVLRGVGLPHSSLRIGGAVGNLQLANGLIQSYRRSHGGRAPGCLAELRMASMKADDEAALRGWLGVCTYNPKAEGQEPLLACSDVIGRPRVAAWLTGSGRVYVARVRLWPRWEATRDGGLKLVP